jgi:hypothetical protein
MFALRLNYREFDVCLSVCACLRACVCVWGGEEEGVYLYLAASDLFYGPTSANLYPQQKRHPWQS